MVFPVVMFVCESWTIEKAEHQRSDAFHCGIGEDSWKSLGLQGDPTSPSLKRSVLGVHWKYWCWSWNSNPLATSCKELTHWKRSWCWEKLRAAGEGANRDGWMASLTQGTWGGWTPGVGDRQGGLAFCGSRSHKELDTTELLNWTDSSSISRVFFFFKRISLVTY